MTEVEWLACDAPTPLLDTLGTMSTRKRLLFGVACCRRVACLLTDRRAANGLALVERFADGAVGSAELTSARSDVGDAVDDAFAERYKAEADVNFCTHPVYSAALAMESAVYAVGGLFDQAGGEHWAQERGSPVRNDRLPHEQAAWAVYCYAESFIVWAHAPRPGGKQQSPTRKVASVLSKRVRSSETESQASLLRDIFGNPFRPVAFYPLWRTDTAVALARQMYESRDFGVMPILADALQDAGCEDADILDHCRDPKQAHVRGCWVVDFVLGKE